ncbi:MAG TPA: SPOR domain-containing protein [Steroidobacteraceae bacterium]|nr:SPOR domain-containing protein [Steroidobacteraceae bacterium]
MLPVAALLIGLAGPSAQVAAAIPSLLPTGPIVQLIDTQELEDHAEISIQFACSVRYVANTPVSHGTGTTITLRLGPDCGTQFSSLPPELPLVGGGGHLVTGARVDSIVPGEITLELTWSKALDFVMAPTASGLGLRVRLLNTNRRKGKVLLSESEPPGTYAVNLDSSQTPYPRETVEAAAASLQTQAYVSETDIEDQHWYRLRLGPFTTRSEAERVLKVAQAKYPRAWLADNDEQTDLSGVETAGVASSAANAPTDPALPDDQRAQILRDARTALEKHKYPEAVDLLNRLLRQPEYPERRDAQELMGLVRERAGQLAQAKAEYQEYLRRYPDGAGAARVRGRLQTLAAASLAPKTTGEFGAAESNRWTMAGSAAVSYQYGRDQTVSGGTTTTTNTLSSALFYGDLLLRDRGERYDFTARVNGGYTENLGASFGGGSQDRINAAYVEVTDKSFGLTGRFGRQSLASQGIIGLFDGLFVGYQVNPKLAVSGAAGLPAYTGYSAVSSHERFGTVAAEFDPFHQAWVFDAYFFDQTNEGQTDRRSIGLQTRYSVSGRTAVLLVDYDIAFQQINSATLIGNSKVGQNWVLSFDADHRRSPLLQLNNALIGQSALDLNSLQAESMPPLTPSQIRQLALDRTATSNTFVVSASRPFGERWQFMADLGGFQLSGTPSSPAIGGVSAVSATQSTGLDKNISLQMAGSSLLQANDLHIFSARYDNSPQARSTTLSWDARFVVHGNWRLGPRLSVEELNDPTLGGKQRLYLPQVRTDWTNRFSVFEATAGYQLQNQQAVQQLQSLTGQTVTTSVDQHSLYVTVAYRVRF